VPVSKSFVKAYTNGETIVYGYFEINTESESGLRLIYVGNTHTEMKRLNEHTQNNPNEAKPKRGHYTFSKDDWTKIHYAVFAENIDSGAGFSIETEIQRRFTPPRSHSTTTEKAINPFKNTLLDNKTIGEIFAKLISEAAKKARSIDVIFRHLLATAPTKHIAGRVQKKLDRHHQK